MKGFHVSASGAIQGHHGPLVFTYLQYKSLENTVEKGEIVRYEQFLLFPQSFLPIGELSVILIKLKIVVCKLFQFGRV